PFNSGATFTYNTGTNSGNAFTNGGTANAVVFASGATYIAQSGANPFALGQPSSKVVFQTGSLYKIIGTSAGTGLSLSGRTYANFELNSSGQTFSGNGGASLSIDNLTISQGTFQYQMTATPGHAIKG